MINLQFSHCNVDYRICQLAFTDCNVITIIFFVIFSKYQADEIQFLRQHYNYTLLYDQMLYRNISPFCEPLSFDLPYEFYTVFSYEFLYEFPVFYMNFYTAFSYEFLCYFIRTFTLHFIQISLLCHTYFYAVFSLLSLQNRLPYIAHF